jgi:hypothetical protein
VERNGSVTDIFWSAAAPESIERTPRDVVRHALGCLEAFEAGQVFSSKSGKPINLMELLADVGIEEDLVYASPELARGESFDERSLVFTLGVLIFERLTGRHPFGTSDAAARVARIRRGEMGSGVNYFPQVPADLRGILMRSMGPFPEERYRSLQEMKEALRKFGGVQPGEHPGKPKFFQAPTRVAPSSLMDTLAHESQQAGPRPHSVPDWMDPDAAKAQAGPAPRPGQSRPTAAKPAAAPPSDPEVATPAGVSISADDLNQLFDDVTDQSPPPSAPMDAPASPGPVEPAARSVGPQRRHGPTATVAPVAGRPSTQPWLVRLQPLLYGVIGAAVATIFMVMFWRTEELPPDTAPAARPHEPPTVAAPAAPAAPVAKPAPAAPAAPVAKPAPAAKPAPVAKPAPAAPAAPVAKPAPAAPTAPVAKPAPAAADLSPGEAAGHKVGETVRTCLPRMDKEVRLRVAVYLQPGGEVTRAFVAPGPGTGKAVVGCIKTRLAGMQLAIRLPKADFVEWKLEISPEGVTATVVRPKSLR